MLEVKGKYNQAKIFTDVVDQASVAQVVELCNQEFAAGSRIRLMPDIHAGAGCTIGTTMTITDKVVPNLVGVDIGCGMETIRVREDHLELQKLDKLIYEKIPSGFAIRAKAHRYLDQIDLEELCCARHVDLLRAEKSIGTLGGGNHFIEVDRDEDGRLYVVVHSGSRHHTVCALYRLHPGKQPVQAAHSHIVDTFHFISKKLRRLRRLFRHRDICCSSRADRNLPNSFFPFLLYL